MSLCRRYRHFSELVIGRIYDIRVNMHPGIYKSLIYLGEGSKYADKNRAFHEFGLMFFLNGKDIINIYFSNVQTFEEISED